MTDVNRVYDGFSVLDGGMDAGNDASLIGQNQVALSVNYTFKDGLASIRNPFASVVLTFPSQDTLVNWSGMFQGACFYQSAQPGQSGFVVSIAGRLFRVILGDQNVVTDITPNVSVVTTGNFVVPALNGSVNVNLNTGKLSTGDTLYITGGQYLIQVVVSEQYTLKYLGGSTPTLVIDAGTSVTDVSSNPILVTVKNPSNLDFVDLFQAENYVINLAGQNTTSIFDGSTTRLAATNEIPPGVIGTYAWGRIWVALNDRKSFIAGDLVGSQSGTPSLKYVDAILKVTENNYLNGGGSFTVPSNSGLITAMGALPMLDTSLGIGPVLVGTTNSVISINAPPDRTTWQNLTYPIETISALDYGPQAPRGFISANSDMWYRSSDGYRSFQAARLDFNSWRMSPKSNEINPILDADSKQLLFYGSQIIFDGRMFATVSPYRSSSGVCHRGMAMIDFGPITRLNGQSPPIWEGIYTGLQILQLVKGVVDGVERAFAFVLNGTTIEIWEFLRGGKYDQFTTEDAGVTLINRTAISGLIETGRKGFGSAEQLKGLYTAELYLDNIVDNLTVTVKWRPDEYPAWTTWATLNFCVENGQCTLTKVSNNGSCQPWQEYSPQYAARVMLPAPDEIENAISGGYLHDGYEFQFRIETLGNVRVRKFKVHAKIRSDKMEGEYPLAPVCSSFATCEGSIFAYDSHGGVGSGQVPFVSIGGIAVPIPSSINVLKIWDAGLKKYVYYSIVGGILQADINPPANVSYETSTSVKMLDETMLVYVFYRSVGGALQSSLT